MKPSLLRFVVRIALPFFALTISSIAQQANVSRSTQAPLTVTLQDALARAKSHAPQYRAAVTDYRVAREATVASRAALLPSVNYNAGFLYTQGNGTAPGRFIAANGVHEYLSQGVARETLSLENLAGYRRDRALEALARARSEIAARGLAVTVTQAYYATVVGQRKYAATQRAADEAAHFSDITQKLERGGEVAHSDVLKAQLQLQQEQRALSDAQLEMERARLELAVLIFPDFNENFTTIDDLENPAPLPSYQEVEGLAAKSNPQLAAALAALRAANQEVAAAWNNFLPTLFLGYAYGIDASRFAMNGIDPASGRMVRNLGYAATATLDVPIWSWGAGRSRVKSAHLQRDQARVELSFAQRKMVADLKALYGESQTARSQLDSLRHSADLAAESLRLTTLRYQAGEATALEVVDAQNTLTAAQGALADGEARYRVALAGLETLTGTF
jgi:outer membrane protein TolC